MDVQGSRKQLPARSIILSILTSGLSGVGTLKRKSYMPSMMQITKLSVACAILIGMPNLAIAQEQSQEPVIRQQVTLVNLFVTVRDKSKHIMTEMKQEDFQINEDGQPQKIA